MLGTKKIAVVLPGLNVTSTLARTLADIPRGFADALILVDDGSTDGTAELGRRLGCHVFRHGKNRGYGAAQKTGYREALRLGADVAVMVHPDYQYRPELVPAMASMVAFGGFELALGSRLLMRGALRGGMPVWKYAVNRGLTVFENSMMGAGLSEYHTGYRAFSRKILEELPLAENSNDYVFDNEVIAQALHFGLPIGELSCPARYFEGMQTIHFGVGVKYGIGCVKTAWAMRAHRMGLSRSRMFDASGSKLRDWADGQPVLDASAS